MGFWHTGYMEFHEPVGFGSEWSWTPSVPKWPCDLCDEELASAEELRRHRFEAHPLAQPMLFFRGRQLGRTEQVVTKAAVAADFATGKCDAASINGKPVAVRHVPARLASFTNDTARVTLANSDLSADFELVFALPSESDLLGVERQFKAFAAGHSLDLSAINAFAESCRSFPSAAHYWDGICQYLYGVLTKERSPQASLPFEDYLKKFNQAAHALADYDRRLACAVRSLVSFHFNHFEDAAAQLPGSTLALVSSRFAKWLDSGGGPPAAKSSASAAAVAPFPSLEDALTDATTKAILAVSSRREGPVRVKIDEIQRLLQSNPPALDQVKLVILLAESQLVAGQFDAARRTARPLVNGPGTARWAESMIVRAQERA